MPLLTNRSLDLLEKPHILIKYPLYRLHSQNQNCFNFTKMQNFNLFSYLIFCEKLTLNFISSQNQFRK